MREKLESSIYITVDTLKYLKKGGRITPAAAAIGTVLNLKPVLQIQGEKLDAFAKARGIKSAKKTMLDAMERDIRSGSPGNRYIWRRLIPAGKKKPGNGSGRSKSVSRVMTW